MKEWLSDELRDLESMCSSKGSCFFSFHIIPQYSMVSHMNAVCAWANWTEVADWVMNTKCLTLISLFGCFYLLQTSWWFLLKATLFQWLTWKLQVFMSKCSVMKERKIKTLHCSPIQADLQQWRLFFSKGMTSGLYLHLCPSEISQRNLIPRKSFALFCLVLVCFFCSAWFAKCAL